MEYHLVTEPILDWVDPNQNNLCLSYWPQLLKTVPGSPVVHLPKSPRLTIQDKLERKEEVKSLRKVLSTEFARRLRNAHSSEFADSYWEILIYPWLTCAISNYVSRIHQLKICLNSANILSTCVIRHDEGLRFADDTTDFFKSFHDPVWRSQRDQRILKFLNFRGQFVSKNFAKLDSGLMRPAEKTVVRKVKEKFQTLSMNFTRFNSSYFENTYLPPLTEGFVQILLGQLPVSNRSKNWRNHIGSNDAISPHRDASLSPNYALKSLSSFENFLMEELWTQIPRIFLENYAAVRQISLQLMPKKSAYAFTSNSFHQDEVFKFWIAESKMGGTKYIVGQHGNNYGANLLVSETPEETTCDAFLTWGWSSMNPKYVPSTCLNIAGRTQATSNLRKILLVSKTMPGEDEAWDETREYYDQLVQQHDFVDQLELEIQSNTTIRIAPLNSRVGDTLPNSWSNNIGRCSLDLGEVSYRKIRPDYQLAVFSYDSSGLLEGLASNIPTMGFWLDGLDHLNAFAREKYQYLIDADIVFLDSKKCASKVNEIWDDVSGWWNSSEVQLARSNFCENFCETKQKPASVIASALSGALDPTAPRLLG